MHLKVLLLMIVAAALCADDSLAGTYQLELEPGEGTILLIGDETQLSKVQEDYFSDERKAVPGRKVNFMLLGFYSGTDVDGRAKRLGMSNEEYLDQMMRVYREAGSTVVFAYHGNMQGGENSRGRRFAAIAAKHGLRVILQPNDLYFPGHHYWKIKSYREGLLKGYNNPKDYVDSYLMPRLEEFAPGVADDENILAWQPTEELFPTSEVAYAEYKAAFKRLLPKHLIFQVDSQQDSFEELRSKRPPFPDIVGLDRYPWWIQPAGLGLWTPHYATKWLFDAIGDYAKSAYDLFRAPAVFVMQGCGELSWYSERAAKWGWEPRKDYRSPRIPFVRWVAKFEKFRAFNRYLAPKNAWRLQNWIGVAAGFKGLMYWCGGPLGSPATLEDAWKNGRWTRIGLIYDDFTTHQHLVEVTRSWEEIRRYESLILDMRLLDGAGVSFYKINEPRVYTNAFQDSVGRMYIVVVNGNIGSWDETSPYILDYPKTKLTVNRHGELENYTPLKEARTIRLELSSPRYAPYDLRTMVLLNIAEGSS